MKKFLYIFFLCLSCNFEVYALPRPIWIRAYGMISSNILYDVYATADGGYALCGSTLADTTHGNRIGDAWLLKVNSEGELTWQNAHDLFGRRYLDVLRSVIETDDGGFVSGGITYADFYPEQFRGFRTDEEGELVWNNRFGEQVLGECQCVIETKGGDYLFGGYLNPEGGAIGYIALTGEDGNLILERSFAGDTISVINGIRERPGDGYLLGGSAVGNGGDRFGKVTALVKINGNGIVQWARTYDSGRATSLVSAGDGYALGGYVGYINENNQPAMDFQLIKINSDGDRLWSRRYHIPNLPDPQSCWGIAFMPDGGFYLVGEASDRNGQTGLVIRTDRAGNVLWQSAADNFGIDSWLYNVIADRDGSALIVGSGIRIGIDRYRMGLLMKLPPERFAPRIVSYEPDNLDLSVLFNDSVNFIVHAVDDQGDSLSYCWWIDDSLSVQNDSLFGKRFDGREDRWIKCIVSDGSYADSVAWHVTVTDLYIQSFTPDTLSLALRRGSSVDFALDSVAAVGGNDDVQYLWTKTNLDNPQPEETGRDAGATIAFLQSGNYAVEGLAYRDQSSDEVVWNVAVRGAIWSFAPEDITLEVLPDSLVRFEVVPSEPDSAGWSITWLVDGEVARFDETVLEWRFFGEADSCPPHLVQVVVADSVEADTVTWEVTVRELGIKSDEEAGRIRRSVLLNVSPNPFNSMLTIKYTTGSAARPTRLAIYDVSGREVVRLVDGGSSVNPPWLTGRNSADRRGSAEETSSATWNASSVPAGVYLVRLQTGQEVSTKKVVLIR